MRISAYRANPVRLAACLFLVTGLSGCIVLPIPHRNTLRPHIEGTVTLDDRPWTDAELVFTSSWPSCTAVGKPVTTDGKGRFQFSLRKKRKWFIAAPLAPLHRLHTAAVCVVYEGAMRPIFVMQEYGGSYDFFQEGIGHLPAEFRITCALKSETLGREIDLTRCRSEPDWPQSLPGEVVSTE